MKEKIFCLFLLVFVFVFLNFFSVKIKNFFYYFSSPFQSTILETKNFLANFFYTFTKKKHLIEENEKLKKQIYQLMVDKERLYQLERENEILKKALKIQSQNSFEFFSSQFVSKIFDSPDKILIKGGKRDGIKKGDPVITPEKVLVGRVEETFENFSLVSLISQKDFAFVGKVLNKEKIQGVVKGKGNGKVLLEKIPLFDNLKEGDVIITSILGGIFPEGLLVGEVKKIEKSDLEPFQKAQISPFFKKEKLNYLFVIIKW